MSHTHRATYTDSRRYLKCSCPHHPHLSTDRKVCSSGPSASLIAAPVPLALPSLPRENYQPDIWIIISTNARNTGLSTSNQWPVECASAAEALHVWKCPTPHSHGWRLSDLACSVGGLVLVRAQRTLYRSFTALTLVFVVAVLEASFRCLIM